MTALVVSVSNAQQCPPQNYPDYTVDCGTGGCCTPDNPVCCNSIYYTNGWCCPEGTECCLDQLGNPDCCLTGQTTTVPSATTTTSVSGGGATTTTPGGGGSTYIAAINITGSGAQDAPQPSGTLPGTSPSETAPLSLYSGTGRPLPLIIQDRFFPPLDKKLYERSLETLNQERLSAGPQISTYAIGDVKQFWVKDDNDNNWRQVAATSKKEGVHSIIYVDNALNMADADLETYVTEFEEMFTIISNNIGTFSDRDGNGKIIIFIYDINDSASISTGWLAGYFWSKDYINDSETKSQGIRSNEADMIYIRGNAPTGWNTQQYGDFAGTTLTTLIHEYQHMVHFCILYWQPKLAGKTGNFDDTWINEMMSMASETMYFQKKLQDNSSYTHDGMLPGGYLEDRVGYYNKDPKNSIRNGHGLCYWDNNGDVFSNYTLSYIFGQYLNLQSSIGDAIYKEILNYMVANSVYDYQAVAGVAKQRLTGIGNWEDLIKSWAIANMLNQANGLYGYKGAFSLTPHGPTTANVTMHSGGVAYRLVNGSWTRPADAGINIKYYGFSLGEVPSTSTVPPGQTTTTTTGSVTTTTIGNTCSPNLVDCGDGNCCPSNLPVCGTGANVGQCFSKGPCAASLMLGDNSYEANLLRAFRNQVLERTGKGTKLSNLYYQHTGELVVIIFGNPGLYSEVMEVTGQMIPAIESALQGTEVSIDKDVERKIDQLCEKIARKASPDLKKAVDKIRAGLHKGQLLSDLGIKK
jgi:hypothetical protein